MKLREIIERVIRSNINSSCVDLQSFIYDNYGIHLDNYIPEENHEVRSYYFAHWMCTDTYVGGKVYFLKGKPICVSWQPARKSDEVFEWLEGAQQELLEYAKQFITHDPCTGEIADLDEELPDGYTINYADELLTSSALYLGEPVSVKRIPSSDSINKIVQITLPSGEEKQINVNELLIPWHLEPPLSKEAGK